MPPTRSRRPAAVAVTPPMIQVRGAATHNLQHIDVDLPRGKIVVITGVSGSGKSSLVYDTLHAIAQRRFLQTLGSVAASRLEQLPHPDVVSVRGLPPTVCLDQQRLGRNPRGTLATLTEVQPYLRVLFSRLGIAHCPNCREIVQPQSQLEIARTILSGPAGTKLMLLAPIPSEPGTSLPDVLARLAPQGLVRVRLDGELHDLSAPLNSSATAPQRVEAVVDRLILKPGLDSRLAESLALALKLGGGTCTVSTADGVNWQDRTFTNLRRCASCDTAIPEIEPRSFSFHSPAGACPRCHGLGIVSQSGTDRTCPECQGARLGPVSRLVEYSGWTLPQWSALNIREGLSVVRDWLRTAIEATAAIPALLEPQLALKLLQPIVKRLELLREMGLDYLTLDRSALSLSGGEYQRARLGGCLGTGLLGVCYLLDEPTAGLHPRDTRQLQTALLRLRDQGGSVVLVEHDLELIRQADWIVDLGPGAGAAGGRVLAAGTAEDLIRNSESVTGAALRESAERFSPSQTTSSPGSGDQPALQQSVLQLTGACQHNLKRVEVQIPLGKLVCVSGVSGSGKSTLIFECLVPLLRSALAVENSARASIVTENPACGRLVSSESLQRLILVDQSPLGRGGRACPATGLGVWDFVRKLLSQTRTAKVRGYTAQRFSWLHAAGRCPACRGHGWRARTAGVLGRLPQICSTCHGTRFQASTLEVKYRGKSAAELLDLRIDEAADFFSEILPLKQRLEIAREIGLGHQTLGQPAPTLSGGEAQRIKLAAELGQAVPQQTLYILDEPTSGLHQQDVTQLLQVLRRLVAAGQTVLVVEHHPAIWQAADWLIDLGPGSGPDGGQVVAQGSLADLIATADSATGKWLRKYRSGE